MHLKFQRRKLRERDESKKPLRGDEQPAGLGDTWKKDLKGAGLQTSDPHTN